MNPAAQRRAPSQPLAYTVTSPEEHLSAVVFHAHAVAARRLGAREVDEAFGDVTLRRAPEFDPYAPGPVPDEVLYRNGWFLECRGCSSRVSEQRVQDSQDSPEECGYLRENWESVQGDENDGGGLPLAPVFLQGGGVFCCPACQAATSAQEAALQEAKDVQVRLATDAALARFPGCTVLRVWTNEARRPVDLALPAGTDGQQHTFSWDVGEDAVHCPHASTAAWESYWNSIGDTRN